MTFLTWTIAAVAVGFAGAATATAAYAEAHRAPDQS